MRSKKYILKDSQGTKYFFIVYFLFYENMYIWQLMMLSQKSRFDKICSNVLLFCSFLLNNALQSTLLPSTLMP